MTDARFDWRQFGLVMLAGMVASFSLPPFGLVPLIAVLSLPALMVARADSMIEAGLIGGAAGFGWFLGGHAGAPVWPDSGGAFADVCRDAVTVRMGAWPCRHRLSVERAGISVFGAHITAADGGVCRSLRPYPHSSHLGHGAGAVVAWMAAARGCHVSHPAAGSFCRLGSALKSADSIGRCAAEDGSDCSTGGPAA